MPDAATVLDRPLVSFGPEICGDFPAGLRRGTLPGWTCALGDALLQKRVGMAHGANTTYVMYRLLRATRAVELGITPLVTYRDFHTLTSGRGWRPAVKAEPRGVEIRAFEGASPFRIWAEPGRFVAHEEGYWNFLHR